MRTNVQVEIPKGELVRRGGRAGGRRREGEDFERFKQACREFESVLVEQMVKEMRTGDVKSKLFGHDSGMETYREMLDGEYVRLMTERGGIGLADFMIENTPRELIGKSGPLKPLRAAKAAGLELDRVSSFRGMSRQSLQTGLPAPSSLGANGRPGN
jgi:Rod binding domain-containing protein